MLYYCALVRSNKVHSTYKKSCRFLLICNVFCTFAPESYAGGKYVLRKAFRNGSFLGRFLTY